MTQHQATPDHWRHPMENDKTINPELVKWCAEVAVPERTWGIHESANHEFFVVDIAAPYTYIFDPPHDDSDCHVLMVALLRLGWSFHYAEVNNFFFAGCYAHESQQDESLSMLLLKAASAQSGIPMYV